MFEGTVSGDSGDIAIDDISVNRGACGVRVKNHIKLHGNVSLVAHYVLQFRFFSENKSRFFSSNISLVCSLPCHTCSFSVFDILFFFFQTTQPSDGLEFFTCNFEQDACINALESVKPVTGGPEFEWSRNKGKNNFIFYSTCIICFALSLTINVGLNSLCEARDFQK